MIETTVTITVGELERDVRVRALVNVAPGLGMGGGWGAEVDGQIELLLEDEWVELEEVPLDVADVERIDEALCDKALDQ